MKNMLSKSKKFNFDNSVNQEIERSIGDQQMSIATISAGHSPDYKFRQKA